MGTDQDKILKEENDPLNKSINEYSAGFIVFRMSNFSQREYLILHYPSGHFDFPKGHLEGAETPKEAALRELEEETGITKIEIIENFEIEIHYAFRRGPKMVNKTVTFFLAKTNQSEVKVSHEHQGSLWLPFDQAMQKVTFDNARQVLSKSEEKLNHIN